MERQKSSLVGLDPSLEERNACARSAWMFHNVNGLRESATSQSQGHDIINDAHAKIETNNMVASSYSRELNSYYIKRINLEEV